MLYLLWVIGTRKVYQVSCVFWHSRIIAELFQFRNIFFHSYKLDVPVLDLSCPVPDVHHGEHYETDHYSNIATVNKFIHQRHQKTRLNHQVAHQKEIDQTRFHPVKHQVVGKEYGGHDHRSNDRQPIRSFHAGGFTEV